MTRRFELLIVVALTLRSGGVAPAQDTAASPRLEFEVASVRPSAPGAAPGGIGRPVNGLVRATATTVRQMIHYAYDLMPLQRHDPASDGGPAWIDTERFDIMARGPDDLSFADSRAMLLALLQQRFTLRTHTEKRDAPVYSLELARRDGAPGAGLRRSQMDCAAYSATLTATGRGAAAIKVGPGCGLNSGGAPAVAATLGLSPAGFARGSMMTRGTATMAELVTVISRSPDIDRKILDRTGLSGTFDIELLWNPLRQGPFTAAPADVVPIVTALQEQLGLKLVPQRQPVEVVIVDAVERPTPN
jgi:uncharacterized protein (TIGR03435 family)